MTNLRWGLSFYIIAITRKIRMSDAANALLTTTADLLEHAAAEYGQRPFIVDGDLVLSFEDTLEQVRAIACALIEDGFVPGQRGVIWAPNSAAWIIAALALQYAGGTLVTLNTRYKGAEAAAVINDSGAHVGFIVDELLGVGYPQMLEGQNCGALQQQIVIGSSADSETFTDMLARGTALLADGEKADALKRARSTVSANTCSDILFTSGTTGRAKGVVTEHGQNLRAFSHFADILGINADDRYLIINPFFHSFGYKAGWLAALLRGATVYPMAVFDVDAVMAAVEAQQITVMPGPPTLFQSILNHPSFDASKFASLKKATTGAAIIPTALIVAMREQLGIDTVLTAYGLSETCGLVTICRAGDSAELIATTSGRAIPDVEVGIMDDTGKLLAAGETGEIVVRGFNVMRGYLDNPDATRETIDDSGWLHTGDVGHLDDAGNLSITDRLKDMFICGGFNCYPAEIENQLMSHPDIAQAAVIGAPDERMGEVGAAFIVPKTNHVIDEAILTRWCREHMANYKVPRYFYSVDSLPLNASGKVLKTELRQQLTNA